ncbi:hypothetical protein M2158_006825 [Streptomyces sp. SAI-144]|nr:hypothetical protein [Streptomyces sp. SAI-144]
MRRALADRRFETAIVGLERRLCAMAADEALVICSERGVIGTGFAEVRPRHLPGGLVEVDPAELYDSVIEAGSRALAEAGEPVVALGLANQGETVLAWDPVTGRPSPVGAAGRPSPGAPCSWTAVPGPRPRTCGPRGTVPPYGRRGTWTTGSP